MSAVNLVRISLYCLLSLSIFLPGCGPWGWGCGGWFNATHERTEDLSTPISPEATLSAKTDVGSIVVTGSSTAECSVHATIKTRAYTSERAVQLADETTVMLNPTAGAVEVKIHKLHLARGECVSVDLKIETPQQVHLDCAACVGEVRISNTTGKIKAAADVGRIICQNVSDQLQLRAKVGEIRVKCIDNTIEPCKIDISTDVGGITFDGPDQLSAVVNASTGVGSIKTYVPISVTGKIGRDVVSSSIAGTIGDGQGSLKLKTGVGSITIK
jgi:hypothetical protein